MRVPADDRPGGASAILTTMRDAEIRAGPVLEKNR
jgi:hypothetical protein